jgi:hypothetical protein
MDILVDIGGSVIYYINGVQNYFWIVGHTGDIFTKTGAGIVATVIVDTTTTTGATVCNPCDLGWNISIIQLTLLGYYANQNGTGYCNLCGDGLSTTSKGSTNCDVICKTGSFSNAPQESFSINLVTIIKY